MPWRLIFAHVRRGWFRAVLTGGGVALAVFLLATLRTVVTGLESTVEEAGANRLITSSALSLFKNLPGKLAHELKSVAGVRDVGHWTWFGGVYIDEDNMFARFATDAASLRRIYGDLSGREEILLDPEEWEAFEADRTGAIVGAALAETYGFEIGDRVPLKGTIYPGDYAFTIRGIFRKGREQVDDTSMFFHWDYLDESAGRPGEVSLFVLDMEPGADLGAVSREVDQRFESSANRTRTLTEAGFNQMFVSMWGNVPLLLSMIGGAVLFASFMIALNTMLLSARERRLEVGVLKALGFPDSTLLWLSVGEGMAICGSGGLLGVLGAKAIFDWQGVEAVYRFFPAFHILPETVVLCVGVAVGVGLVSGLVPGLVARNTKVADALSRFR